MAVELTLLQVAVEDGSRRAATAPTSRVLWMLRHMRLCILVLGGSADGATTSYKGQPGHTLLPPGPSQWQSTTARRRQGSAPLIQRPATLHRAPLPCPWNHLAQLQLCASLPAHDFTDLASCIAHSARACNIIMQADTYVACNGLNAIGYLAVSRHTALQHYSKLVYINTASNIQSNRCQADRLVT